MPLESNANAPSREQLEQLAVHQQARINELESANQRRALDTDIAQAVAASGASIVKGAEQQLLDLIRPTVVSYSDATGARVHGGPQFRPLLDHISDQLNGPLKHFVAGSTSPRPAPGAGPRPTTAGGAAPQPPGPPPNINEIGAKAWVDWRMQQVAHTLATSDPLTDPSRSLIRGVRGAR